MSLVAFPPLFCLAVNVTLPLVFPARRITNAEPLYKMAFKIAGQKYKLPTDYDIYKCYSPKVADILMDLFQSDSLYEMPLVYPKIPQVLNDLMARKDIQLFFVTERVKKQPIKTFGQLRRAGINCTMAQVYDMPGFKPDILKDINPDIHYDDSPNVVLGCIERHVPVAMISNAKTPYNHKFCEYVENYRGLLTALMAEGLYNPRRHR